MISPNTKSLQAIGAELDLTDKGLGLRSRRYTMLVDDGVVGLSSQCLCSMAVPLLLVNISEGQERERADCRHACVCGLLARKEPCMRPSHSVQVKALNLEEGGAFTVSSADNILAGL